MSTIVSCLSKVFTVVDHFTTLPIHRSRLFYSTNEGGIVTRDGTQQEVVPINISDLPITRPDQMQPVSGVVCDSISGHLEITMRITIGGSILELSNNADPTLIGTVLRMLNSSC